MITKKKPDEGRVVSCRMQAKAGSNSLILANFQVDSHNPCSTQTRRLCLFNVRFIFLCQCHGSKVMTVERNPFYPKNFLTVGDTTCKIWSEDLKSSAIMWMKPAPVRLTGGAWSPARWKS